MGPHARDAVYFSELIHLPSKNPLNRVDESENAVSDRWIDSGNPSEQVWKTRDVGYYFLAHSLTGPRITRCFMPIIFASQACKGL